MKKLFLISTVLVLLVSVSKAQITPQDAILQMRKGINLGNSLEASGGETNWGNPRTTEAFFDMYKDAGFNTVRIPVRWDERTGKSFPYQVQSSFLSRVEELVDWGLERDLFIVINAHHDNWIKDNYSDPLMRERFDSIWSQIATYFAGKSEKLVFEILNEPHGLTIAQNDDMHARVLSIIRKTNPTRLVIFQGNGWGSSGDLLTAAIPDPDDPYLIGSFHSYDPWPFGLEGTGSFGSTADINTLKNKFISVKNWSDTHNIPVFLGEFACHRNADFMSRMKHYQTYVELAHSYGFCYCSWDDGGQFEIMERKTGTWKQMKDILIYGKPESPKYSSIKIYQDTSIQISWDNRTTENDRIIIQRGSSPAIYSSIDTLPKTANMYIDENLPQGKNYYYRIISDFDEGDPYYSHPVMVFLPTYVEAVRALYLGAPLAIPGIIEAEDFDIGGERIGYHDTDARNTPGDYRSDVGVDIYDRLGDGFHIGNIMEGEWLEYTVDVAEADTFKVIAQLATPYAGGTFTLKIGEVESGIITTRASANWLLTDTVSCMMILEEGEQIMRFTMLEEPTFNLDRIVFETYSSIDTISIDTTSTDTTIIDTTAIESALYRDEDLFVYTNQTGNIQFKYKGEEVLKELKIYSISGNLEMLMKNPAPEAEISVQSFRSGVYFIKLQSENYFYLRKIFISN